MKKFLALAGLLAATPALAEGPYEGGRLNWSGLYVGAHAGYAWGDSEIDLSNSTGAIFYDDPFVPDHGSKSYDGFLGGLQTGYNQQFGRWVVGLEADVSWTDLETEATVTTPKGSQWNIKGKLDTLGTVRGRLGLLLTDRLLAYGTGGLAWGQVDLKQATTFVDGKGNFLDDGGRTSGDFNHIGWVAGGGIEFMLTEHITIRGEYLHVDLGKEDYQLTGTTKPNGGAPYVETFAADHKYDIVRGALNYKF